MDDIELMISVRSEMLKQKKEDRESVASFVKVGRLLLLLFKDRMELILLEIFLRYSSGEKLGGGEFLWRSLEREDHQFLEEEKKTIDCLRYEECLV